CVARACPPSPSSPRRPARRASSRRAHALRYGASGLAVAFHRSLAACGKRGLTSAALCEGYRLMRNMTGHRAIPFSAPRFGRRMALLGASLFAAMLAGAAAEAGPYETVGQHYELRLSDLPAPYS